MPYLMYFIILAVTGLAVNHLIAEALFALSNLSFIQIKAVKRMRAVPWYLTVHVLVGLARLGIRYLSIK